MGIFVPARMLKLSVRLGRVSFFSPMVGADRRLGVESNHKHSARQVSRKPPIRPKRIYQNKSSQSVLDDVFSQEPVGSL